MNNNLYGSKERAEEKKSRNKQSATIVKDKMQHLYKAHLPAAFENPVSHELLGSQVKKFQGFLREEYEEVSQLKIAFIELAYFIADGNDKGAWSVDIPPTITSIPRTSSSRSHRNFIYGSQVGRLYQKWSQEIENAKLLPDPRSRLADVLISAIFYGGLANPRAVTSFANKLVVDKKPFQVLGDGTEYCWVELDVESGSDPLNYKKVCEHDGSTTWESIHRFYLDNRTIGQAVRFQGIRNDKAITNLAELNQIDVWEIIKSRLESDSESVKIQSLGAFCTGAQGITEMLEGIELPQALLECAAGRVGTVSLPPKYLQNWLLKTRQASTPMGFSLQDALSGCMKHDSKGTSAKKHINYAYSKLPIDRIIREIRVALQSSVSGQKVTQKEAVSKLKSISEQSLPLNASILVDWLVHTLTERKNKVSSAYRYFSELAEPWLFHTLEVDLDDLTESELEYIYRQILSFKPGDNNQALNYLQGRLHDLHRFASGEGGYDLPTLAGFFDQVSQTEAQTQVKAGYIPEHNFQSMLRNLEGLTDTDPHTKEGFCVLLILAYRTGMRRGELLKVRLSDIESSDELWIYVLDNRYGNNKSDSARRRVPAHLLLRPKELDRFHSYLKKRITQNKHQTSTLLFSEPHAVTTPYQGSLVSGLIKALLSFEGLEDLSFHHLRHSALTSLLVVMEESPELITSLTGYSLEQAKKIRSELFCSNMLCGRDKYSALAGLAGHLSPAMTFLHYFHEVSLLVWKRLMAYDPLLDKDQLMILSGLSAKAVSSHLKKTEGQAKLSTMRVEMLRRLAPMSHRMQLVESNATVTEMPNDPPLKVKYTVSDCYAVLRDLEQGDSVSTLSVRYGIDREKLNQWLEAANTIQGLTTKNGNRRHFPKKMRPTAIGVPLAPIRPQDRATATEIDNVINLLRSAYLQDRDAIIWNIDYWKHNTSQTKPGTRFTQVQEAEKFISCLEGVIPKNRLEFHILITPKTNLDDVKVWQSLGVGCQIKETAQGKSVQAYLRLRHVNEKEIVGSRKHVKHFSSQLLNYVFHMLAIMVDRVSH